MPSLVLAYVFGFMVLVSAHEAAARPKVQCPWARSPGELPNPLQRLKNWIPILPHPRALWVRGLAIGPAKRRGRTWLKDVKGGVKSDLDQVTYPGIFYKSVLSLGRSEPSPAARHAGPSRETNGGRSRSPERRVIQPTPGSVPGRVDQGIGGIG